MILFRIARKRYAEDLSGRGGLLSFARWHDHLPVIYSSLSSSTCILEKLVHLQPEEIHHDLVMAKIEVDGNVSSLRLETGQLPMGWNNYPSPDILKKTGNAWLQSQSSLLLFVPSAIDLFSQNVLINPLHTEANLLTIKEISPFSFDDRLLK